MTREEREKAIDALKISAPVMAVTQEEFNDYIQTLNKIMNWLEQEPCDDAINRQAVLNLAKFDGRDGLGSIIHAFDVEQLPPVKPAEKVGQWIDGKCNKCGTHAPFWAMASTYYCSEYCPSCGSKMQEVSRNEAD